MKQGGERVWGGFSEPVSSAGGVGGGGGWGGGGWGVGGGGGGGGKGHLRPKKGQELESKAPQERKYLPFNGGSKTEPLGTGSAGTIIDAGQGQALFKQFLR